jgi:class 3 adenylate cyclase
MRCSKCGIENREGRKFCADCGTPIAAKCARCGASNQPGERFCGECGATLDVIASGSSEGAPQTASAVPVIHARDEHLKSAAAEGERRHLTVMFCDLVGSTALSQRLDPEELREVMRAYHETCADVIKRFDGYVAKYLGDGLLIYFGYPRAHEDDAQRAVRAGLGIIEELKTLNLQESTGGQRIPLHTRIGIHTGLVVVGQMGIGEQREASAIVGETPNLAARIQQLADPDTVVIGDPTHRLIQPFFACEDAGTQRLKGITNPVRLYRVRERTEVHSRFEAVVRTGLTSRRQEGDLPPVGEFLQAVIEAAGAVRSSSAGNIDGITSAISDRLGIATVKRSFLTFILEKFGAMIGARKLEALAVRNIGPMVPLHALTLPGVRD